MAFEFHEAFARAEALLAESILVDGHNDLPWVIRADRDARGDVRAYGLQRAIAGADTDIPKMRAGKIGAQIWAAFVPPNEPRPASFALQQIALIHSLSATHPDVFAPALSCADIRAAKRSGKIASIVAIENGAAIENRLDALDAYYALGVRLMTLCHNATLDWVDSATDAPRNDGLNDLGRAIITRMNDLGMIVDLSHASDGATRAVLSHSRAPVVFSHSNARALCDHPRNLSDELLALAAEKDALVMANFVPNFICQRSENWLKKLRAVYAGDLDDEDAAIAAHEPQAGPWPRGTLTQYCDHLDYLKGKVGADRIGIGSDFFGGPQGEGLKDASCFPHIFAELIQRGWPEADLRKLAGENFLRVFAHIEHCKARA
jgi:membrane dipeptidase